MAQRGQIGRRKGGSLLIEEGEPEGCLHFVVEGSLRAFTGRPDGQEFTFGCCGAGEILGQLSLDGGTRSASVTVEEAVVYRWVKRPVVEQCIVEEPGLAFELTQQQLAQQSGCGRPMATKLMGDLVERAVCAVKSAWG